VAASHDTDPARFSSRERGKQEVFLRDTSRVADGQTRLYMRGMAVDVIDPIYRFVHYIEIRRYGT